MSSIFIQEGTTAEFVTKETNQTNTMDPVLTVNPPRGTAMALVNHVEQGDQRLGVPVVMKLKDSNGNLLPVNTEARFEILGAGMSDPVAVSEQLESIADYNTLSVKQQRNTEHIDATKILLQQPETQGGNPVPAVSWRDIDEFRFSIEASSAIDWSKSEFSLPPVAVKGPEQRGE